jgi:hypothetical protein
MDTQDKARSGLVDKTSGLQSEKTGKLSTIKNQVANTNTWYDQKMTEIGKEKASLLSQADQEYQKQVGDIQFNERTYGIDQSADAEQAQIEYESKLAAIGNYIGNKVNQLNTIASSAKTTGSTLGDVNTQATDVINKNANINSGMTGATNPLLASITGTSGDSTSTASRSLLDTYLSKLSPTEQYLYGYASPLTA